MRDSHERDPLKEIASVDSVQLDSVQLDEIDRYLWSDDKIDLAAFECRMADNPALAAQVAQRLQFFEMAVAAAHQVPIDEPAPVGGQAESIQPVPVGGHRLQQRKAEGFAQACTVMHPKPAVAKRVWLQVGLGAVALSACLLLMFRPFEMFRPAVSDSSLRVSQGLAENDHSTLDRYAEIWLAMADESLNDEEAFLDVTLEGDGLVAVADGFETASVASGSPEEARSLELVEETDSEWIIDAASRMFVEHATQFEDK